MPGLSKTVEKPDPFRLVPPRWLPTTSVPRVRKIRKICYHGPGEHHYYCPCYDCYLYYTRDLPSKCDDADTLEVSRPKYAYMGLVNSLLNGFAKREEDRQDKLRAEREASAAAVEALKKDKASKDQPKNN